jgi:hypothetical protein
MLLQASSNLEEIERDSYKDREAWSITLSFLQTRCGTSGFRSMLKPVSLLP